MTAWSQETKVGLFLLLGLLIIVVLVFHSGTLSFKPEEKVEIHAVFGYVSSGLVIGAPVQLAGVDIGRVKNVQLQAEVPTKVIVTLEVQPNRVRQADTACMATIGLLGDKYICIMPSSTEAPFVVEGAEIKGESPVRLEDLVKLGEQITREMNRLLSAFNEMFTSPATRQSVQEVIENSREVSKEAKLLVEKLSQVVDENRSDFKTGVTSLKDAAEQLKTDVDTGIKDINKLIQELGAITGENREAVRETVANFRAASEDLKHFSGELERRGWARTMFGSKGKDSEKKAQWPWRETVEP